MTGTTAFQEAICEALRVRLCLMLTRASEMMLVADDVEHATRLLTDISRYADEVNNLIAALEGKPVPLPAHDKPRGTA